MKQRKERWLKVLLVLLLIAIMADVTIRLLLAEEKTPSRCLAIPTRFILEYPECAQRLVEAANVTNVRIVATDTFESRRLRELNLSKLNLSD